MRCGRETRARLSLGGAEGSRGPIVRPSPCHGAGGVRVEGTAHARRGRDGAHGRAAGAEVPAVAAARPQAAF